MGFPLSPGSLLPDHSLFWNVQPAGLGKWGSQLSPRDARGDSWPGSRQDLCVIVGLGIKRMRSTSLKRARQALNMVKDGRLRKAGRTPV